MSDIDLTILLPCFDEQEAVVRVIEEVRAALAAWPGRYEILVVDDASSDATAARALAAGARVIQRAERGGSGAARKTGIRAARGRLIAMLDADGTYVPAHLPELLAYLPAYDQVNGARRVEAGTLKTLRVPAKWLIRKLAEWISGKRIPDLNTGMKVFKKDVMQRYLWVVPDGFSCVSSMSLAFLCNGHAVRYVPVGYRARIGRSKFHPVTDTFQYFATVVRMVMYFRPLRVFGPLAVGTGLVALGKGFYDWALSPKHTFQESDVILAVAALMILVVGLLADLIVAQRRELDIAARSDARELAPGAPALPAEAGMPRAVLDALAEPADVERKSAA
jgi:glycosyltransferase involved in cell wall biosynthesis